MPVPSVKFYIESRAKANGNDKKLLPIFLYVRHSGKTLKLFINRKCPPIAWDEGKARVIARRYGGAIEINSFLNQIEDAALNLYHYNSRNGIETTKEHLVKIIQGISGEAPEEMNLISFAKDWVSKAAIKESSKQAYLLTVDYLTSFSSKKRMKLSFKQIDLNFYDEFTSWLWDNHSLNDNTVGKHFKNIKALMNQAFERDLHTNLSFKKKSFHVFKRSGDSIYLNESELQRLLDLDLSENARLERVRDVFIVGCWTGLRFSDLVRLTKDKFIVEDGIQLLRIETEKTGEVVKIPVSPLILPLLERYGYNMPVFSNPKMNQYLKELGRLDEAELNYEVEVSDVRAGKKTREKFKKYELITTHTARRSFASNLYLQGIPSRSIMAITGHRTEKSFMEYIKLSHMEKIRGLDSHFKQIHKPNLKIA